MVKQLSRNILVISPVPTHPLNAGNRARVTALIESLQGLGHSVSFAHVTQEVGDPVAMREKWGNSYYSVTYRKKTSTSLCRRLYRKLQRVFRLRSRYVYAIDAWYDSSMENPLIRLTRDLKIDTVIVEYVWFSKILEVLDRRILKIIDAHDKFSDRHLHYLEQNRTPSWFSTTKQGESKGFDRADVVMAIQDAERDIFAGMTHTKIRTVGHVVPITKPISREDTDGYILFVASANVINLEGINWFVNEVYPGIRTLLPEVELKIAGTICDKLSDCAGVTKLGRVECLQDLYKGASVVINPVSIYTGLSIKTLEALSYSKPLVSKILSEDVDKSNVCEAYRCAATVEEFSAAVLEVLGDSEEYSKLSHAACEYVIRWNRQTRTQLTEVLETRDEMNLNALENSGA